MKCGVPPMYSLLKYINGLFKKKKKISSAYSFGYLECYLFLLRKNLFYKTHCVIKRHIFKLWKHDVWNCVKQTPHGVNC